MRNIDVQVKKLRAVCDLLESSPNGPNKYDQALAANVVKDVSRMLADNETELMAKAGEFADSLRT